jgi:hypothetical protein
MVVTVVEPMSLNNIVLIVTASVSEKKFVDICILLVYVKSSACGAVSSGRCK